MTEEFNTRAWLTNALKQNWGVSDEERWSEHTLPCPLSGENASNSLWRTLKSKQHRQIGMNTRVQNTTNPMISWNFNLDFPQYSLARLSVPEVSTRVLRELQEKPSRSGSKRREGKFYYSMMCLSTLWFSLSLVCLPMLPIPRNPVLAIAACSKVNLQDPKLWVKALSSPFSGAVVPRVWSQAPLLLLSVLLPNGPRYGYSGEVHSSTV